MKAIIRTKYGSPDVLELQETDKPTPTDNQVLVRVQAAAVNPLDWHILRGEPLLVRLMGFGLLNPKHHILGADMAGRVEAVGKDIIQFQVGDEVFGSGMGGFAEYACFREDKLVFKPAAMTFDQVAAAGTNNIIERQLKEIRRRVRLIDSFRDEQSCERIIYTQVKQLNQRLNENHKPQFTQ